MNKIQVKLLGGALLWHGTHSASFDEKIHKPPLRVNVINFELNGFNASIWVPWSPSDPKKLWCADRSIQIHKICVKKKLHVSTYSTVRFTLRFVNLFVEVSRVCGIVWLFLLIRKQWCHFLLCILVMQRLLQLAILSTRASWALHIAEVVSENFA